MRRLIHWSEGMFVRVQALQGLQHGLLERLEGLRGLMRHHPYGVVDAKLDRDALEAGRVKFSRLHVIFRGGTELVAPDDADLDSLDVREALRRAGSTAELVVGVALPEHHLNRPNAFRPDERLDPQVRYRYIPREEPRADDNSGDNEQPLVVRALNARLMFEHSDLTGLHFLPLLKVRKGALVAGAEFRVERVLEYAPPSVFLTSSEAVTELVRLSIQRIESSRGRVLRKLRRDGLNPARISSVQTLTGEQFLGFQRLLILSRHAPRLLALQQTASVTPFELFLGLVEALGELEVLRPALAGSLAQLIYDHDDPYPVFERLAGRLEQALREAEGVNSLRVPFQSEGQNFQATLPSEFFGPDVTGYFLAIRTSVPRADLERNVPNRNLFELTTAQRLGKSFGGLQLAYEPAPPAGLIDEANLHYFRLEHRKLPELWDLIQNAKEMSVRKRVPALDLGDATLTLYATLKPRSSDPDAD